MCMCALRACAHGRPWAHLSQGKTIFQTKIATKSNLFFNALIFNDLGDLNLISLSMFRPMPRVAKKRALGLIILPKKLINKYEYKVGHERDGAN